MDAVKLVEKLDNALLLLNGEEPSVLPIAEACRLIGEVMSELNQAEHNDAHPFGTCPVCQSDPLVLNVGRVHWGVCLTHKMRWQIGSNLFSAWRDEDESIWQKNAELLDSFLEVKDENEIPF